MFSKDTPFDEVYKELQIKNFCEPAAQFFSTVIMDNPGGTFAQAIEKLAEANDSGPWSVWIYSKLKSKCDKEVRRLFLENIKDPMSAFQIYVRSSNITEEEEEILERVFRGKLPNAEKELKNGVVKRAKG